MPKVTVIIPSYNHAKFIAEAIQSVLSQTYQDFDILICDDGSQDNSIEIIRQFTDPRITFIVNPQNLGAAYTVNMMIKQANGKYIALLNSDDIWLPEKLEKQVTILDQNPELGAVFSDAMPIHEDGRWFSNPKHFYYNIFTQKNRSRAEWLRYFFYVGNCICHPSMLIRKSVYENVGGYNRLLASLPDFEMWVRVCAKYDIYILEDKLVKFRILDGECNASGLNPENIVRGQFERYKLFDSFCLIDDIDLFNKVFPEHIVSDVKQVPIQIAKILLDDARLYAKYWAIDKIYQLLSKDYDYYSQSITDTEFIKLTARTDIFNVLGFSNAVIQLFYDIGNGFNSKDYLQQNIKPGLTCYKFDISNIQGIKGLRLDPINLPAYIKLTAARVKDDQGKQHPLKVCHNNASAIVDEDNFTYYHDDPIWVFDISHLLEFKLNKLEVELSYKLIDIHAMSSYISQIVAKIAELQNKITELRNKISNLENEKSSFVMKISNLRSNIASLEALNNSLKDEIYGIYNSKSWKITKPLRKLARLFKRKK